MTDIEFKTVDDLHVIQNRVEYINELLQEFRSSEFVWFHPLYVNISKKEKIDFIISEFNNLSIYINCIRQDKILNNNYIGE